MCNSDNNEYGIAIYLTRSLLEKFTFFLAVLKDTADLHWEMWDICYEPPGDNTFIQFLSVISGGYFFFHLTFILKQRIVWSKIAQLQNFASIFSKLWIESSTLKWIHRLWVNIHSCPLTFYWKLEPFTHNAIHSIQESETKENQQKQSFFMPKCICDVTPTCIKFTIGIQHS